MAFDVLTMASLCKELKDKLLLARVNKISMPNDDEIILNLKTREGNYRLLISSNASLPLIYLSSQNKESKKNAPAFLMLLRKYLNTAKICEISLRGLERIIEIKFETYNELKDKSFKYLIFEMMGKHSNIIFTDENYTILDSIKRVNLLTSSLREILPSKKYFFPKELEKIDSRTVSYEIFKEQLLNSKKSLSKTLYSSFSGLSPLIASELFYLSNLDEDKDVFMLKEEDLRNLFKVFVEFIEKYKEEKFNPHIIYKNDEIIDFLALDLSLYSEKIYKKEYFSSISELLEKYYKEKDLSVRIKQKSSDLRKNVSNLIERNVKKYDLQKLQYKDTENMEKYKVYGDLLSTYSYDLKEGLKEYLCNNYYDDNKEILIKLDATLSIRQNIKKFYDKYAKLKRTKEALIIQIKNTEKEIFHLQNILNSIDISKKEEDLVVIKEELIDCGYIKKTKDNKKNKKEVKKQKALHFISSDGFHIYVGKNNYQNEYLSFEFANSNDWWFHAKNVPGSHVIVKSEVDMLSDTCFEEAASLAAYYSSSRSDKKVEVDYLKRKHLKKVPKSLPGFVIYHTNWSMLVEPKNNLKEIED